MVSVSKFAEPIVSEISIRLMVALGPLAAVAMEQAQSVLHAGQLSAQTYSSIAPIMAEDTSCMNSGGLREDSLIFISNT